MQLRIQSIIFATLLFVVLFGTVSQSRLVAQNQIKSSPADSVEMKKVIEPVSLSDIGAETEQTIAVLRKIKAALVPESIELQVDTLSPKHLAELNDYKKNLDIEGIGQLPQKQKENLKGDFNRIKAILVEWRDLYSEIFTSITLMQSDLNDLETKWTLTLNLERDTKLPGEVLQRINLNLREIGALEKELTTRLSDLLSKQNKLTEGIIYVDEVLSIITDDELIEKENILKIDSPPIWHLFSESPDSLSVGKLIFNTQQIHRKSYQNFIETYQINIFLHLGFFVFLLFFMNLIRTEVKKWSDEKRDNTIVYSLFLISKPIESSVLITFLVRGLFYDDIPGSVDVFFKILVLWPFLALLPGFVQNIRMKYFYVAAGLLLLRVFSFYSEDIPALERLILIANDGGAMVLFLVTLKQKVIAETKDTGQNWPFIRFVLKVALGTLAIALVSNIIGNVSLANLLTAGTYSLVFGGVIIYASAMTLRSLVSLLIQHSILLKLNMIRSYSMEVKKTLFSIIRWAAVILWLYNALSDFEIYNPIFTWVDGFLSRTWQVGSISLSIGSVVAFGVTIWIANVISRFIQFVLKDEIFTHLNMRRGMPGAITMMVRLVLMFLGLILAFGAAKIDINNITIIFGALGVGIGFGLQNIFNNLVSGLIITFERPIQVGDVIQVGNLNLMGEVKEIGIRASIIRTFDGAEVVVPNGNLISNEMINWTLSDDRRRQEILVGVAYGSDTKKVLEILQQVVTEHQNVLQNPSPSVLFLGFGDSSLNFRVLFWTQFDNGLSTKSAVGMAIDEAFRKNGIEIPFPQRDIHIRTDAVRSGNHAIPEQAKSGNEETRNE